MSDMIKDERPRPPIDLDEFERQLRDMQAKPKQGSLDPLAELARIVGQDDSLQPSRGLRPALRSDAPAHPMPSDAGAESLKASLSTLDEMIRPQPAAVSAQPKYASPLDELAAISGSETGPAPDFLQARREPAQQAGDDLHPDADYSYADEPPKRSRTGIKVFLGLVVCGLAGVGAVWSLSGPKSGSTTVASANVPVIAAKPGPLKEKPSDPGGLEIPNQKANVLEKPRDDTKAPQKVLAREEQPVDLGQATKKDIRRVDLGQAGPTGAAPVNIVSVPTVPAAPPPAVASIAPPPPPAPANVESSAAASAALAQIKPVETPAKPDLSAVAAQPTPPPAAKPVPVVAAADPAPPSSVSVPKRVKSIRINSNGEPVDGPASPAASAPPVAAPPAPPPAKAVAAAKTPASTPAVKAPAKHAIVARETTTAPASGDDAAPLQIVPPAGVSRKSSQTPLKQPQRVAAAPVPATDDTTSAIGGDAQPASAKTSAGGRAFSVQFGAPGSTGEANALISRLKSQYPSVMGSVEPRVIKADVKGKSVYRVRSGSLSRDQANTLCSQLKAAGGNCFVSGG
ncbi:MAG: SPOR domain-containing protein [Beijerinckiaceae bacterium]|nr:SPOR domain-containing protein [Beijerinckiaceae bacterium]